MTAKQDDFRVGTRVEWRHPRRNLSAPIQVGTITGFTDGYVVVEWDADGSECAYPKLFLFRRYIQHAPCFIQGVLADAG